MPFLFLNTGLYYFSQNLNELLKYIGLMVRLQIEEKKPLKMPSAHFSFYKNIRYTKKFNGEKWRKLLGYGILSVAEKPKIMKNIIFFSKKCFLIFHYIFMEILSIHIFQVVNHKMKLKTKTCPPLLYLFSTFCSCLFQQY